MSIAEKIVHELITQKLTISTAESCTGGLIGASITDISGASAVYNMGFITYSNDAKAELLGVDANIIKKYGAVSWQTAEQMANGARLHAKSDISVAVTGIAGPKSYDTNKPVGLVFIGLCCEKGCFVVENHFGEYKTREKIRNLTKEKALELVYECVTDYDLFIKSNKFAN